MQDGNAQFVNYTDLIGYEAGITENDYPTWFQQFENRGMFWKKEGWFKQLQSRGDQMQGNDKYCTKQGGITTDRDDSDFEWERDYYGDVILAASKIRY